MWACQCSRHACKYDAALTYLQAQQRVGGKGHRRSGRAHGLRQPGRPHTHNHHVKQVYKAWRHEEPCTVASECFRDAAEPNG